MDNFQRFAIYYAPAPDSTLARAGSQWLGWDADAARPCPHPELGLDLAQITAAPRKYGLHGTLKPPMRLACAQATFFDAVEILAQGMARVDMGRLVLRPLDGFLAIVPDVQSEALNDAAAQIVTALDPFRAPLSQAELHRRRAIGLSPRQDALLLRWGYPYVMEEFRFHITLTDRLAPKIMTDALRTAYAWFDPALAAPQSLDALCIFGEDAQGRFHLLRRVPLRG
ncbi:putative phosphonate metabolism protein [Roseinatronobacter thiooxidans]|uniref:Putative phosphonate metabolism protein n=1 Tax=Roseinatronobacter thiooxidans TaxID=121821 RepID=A0A2W7PR74_9RHOB|nr:DUF1045 domain-containing protein [Roseinatronobacter thiooxidans]PZX38016.1 putative phosphonate metabolism protein [Roseinatronobacter thiooxidans]